MSVTAFIEVLLIGIGLSMDALAVSVAMGALERKNFTGRKIALTSFFFGFFQAVMPLTGWFGGSFFGELVQTCGRIIAAVLLCGIGGKMIHDRNEEHKLSFGLGKLTALAFATSIDALLVGVGFACLNRTSIYADVILIGCTTLLISAAGCITGRTFGNICGNRCEIIGGSVLILIGLKVLCLG